MAALEDRLNDSEYIHWIKCTNGLQLLKEGVQKYVEDTSREFFNSIRDKCPGKCENNCTKVDKSPCTFCNSWIAEIKNNKKGQLIWSNSQLSSFRNDSWELAKLFMSRGQNKPGKNSATATDCSAILQLMSNNKFFLKKMNDGKKYDLQIKQVIEWRNKVMHSANLKMTENDFNQAIDGFIAVLNIPVINKRPDAKDGIDRLNQLKVAVVNMSGGDGQQMEQKAIQTRLDEIHFLIQAKQNADSDVLLSMEEISNLSSHMKKFLAENGNLKVHFDSQLHAIKDVIEQPLLEIRDELKDLSAVISTLQIPGSDVEKNEATATDFDSTKDYVSIFNQMKQKRGLNCAITDDVDEHGKQVAMVTINGVVIKELHPRKKDARQLVAFKAVQHMIKNDVTPATTQTSADNEKAVCDAKDTCNAVTQHNDGASEKIPSTLPSTSVKNQMADSQLDALLKELNLPEPAFKTSQTGDQHYTDVTVMMRYIYATDDSILGRKSADQAAAALVCQELKIDIGKSVKESLKNYCDQNRIAQVKYASYANPKNKQEFYGVAYFTASEELRRCVFHGDSASSVEESRIKTDDFAFSTIDQFKTELKAVVTGQNDVASKGDSIPDQVTSPTKSSLPGANVGSASPSPNKNYVSQLNEFIQRSGLEQYETDYEELDKKFRCTISWPMLKIPITHNPPQYFSSKKEAEKEVAKLALQQNFKIDESTEKSKNVLSETLQKLKTKPAEYSCKEENGKFTASVSFELKKEFSGVIWVDSKKTAKEDAARLALNDMIRKS